MLGGLGDAMPADDETRSMCDQVRGDLETAAGCKFAEYTPVIFRCQTVAGYNFYVKIHIGNGDYIHVKIFRSLDANEALQVHSCLMGKSKDDVIEAVL